MAALINEVPFIIMVSDIIKTDIDLMNSRIAYYFIRFIIIKREKLYPSSLVIPVECRNQWERNHNRKKVCIHIILLVCFRFLGLIYIILRPRASQICGKIRGWGWPISVEGSKVEDDLYLWKNPRSISLTKNEKGIYIYIYNMHELLMPTSTLNKIKPSIAILRFLRKFAYYYSYLKNKFFFCWYWRYKFIYETKL